MNVWMHRGQFPYREPELSHDMTVAEVCTHCLQWVGGFSCKMDGLGCPRFPGARKWVAFPEVRPWDWTT